MIPIITHFAATCQGGNFLLFPPWYKYLNGTTVDGVCTPQISGLSDVWLIVAAAIEILLRVAALVAIGFMIVAGFQFLTSEGDPDKAARARTTAISALVGLAIAILSTALVNFLAGSVH